MKTNIKRAIGLGAFCSALLISCDKGGGSFSLIPDGDSFQQNSSSSVNNKIDILFVVDNSGSMSPAQTNLTNPRSVVRAREYDKHVS